MNWTPEIIEEMLRLQSVNGWTTYQLARHFKVTRNSVCGKLHREKVKRGLIEGKPRVRERRKVANEGTVQKRRYTRRDPMLSLPERAESVSAYVAPKPVAPDLGQLASIVDVTGCKWPVRDDPDFVGGMAFCNHPKDENSPYCPYHQKQSVATYSREVINRTVRAAVYFYKREAA